MMIMMMKEMLLLMMIMMLLSDSLCLLNMYGIDRSIGSCLFDQDVHWWLVVDLGVVDHIVLPLVVHMPFSEQVNHIHFPSAVPTITGGVSSINQSMV